jgi:hypothetical protein
MESLSHITAVMETPELVGRRGGLRQRGESGRTILREVKDEWLLERIDTTTNSTWKD